MSNETANTKDPNLIENFILKIQKQIDEGLEVDVIYDLLDEAKRLFAKCLKERENQGYCKTQLDEFGRRLQWIKSWIREEITQNDATFTYELAPNKDHYLKDWTAYFDRIYEWLKRAFKNGKLDFIEKKQLENLRDGLFERLACFYKTDIEHYKTQRGRLEQQIREQLSKKASGEETSETPETNAKLIYQSDAATFYNIPKSTLSKAAKKKSGESGYLWSSREGKRVILRRNDCQRLAQSRTKLRNV